MKISYLPILFAFIASLMYGTTAKHHMVARQTDVSSVITNMPNLMQNIMSMMMPTQMLSTFVTDFAQMFIKEFNFLVGNLNNSTTSATGRKRRMVYPWEGTVERSKHDLGLNGPTGNRNKYTRSILVNSESLYLSHPLPIPYKSMEIWNRKVTRGLSSKKGPINSNAGSVEGSESIAKIAKMDASAGETVQAGAVQG